MSRLGIVTPKLINIINRRIIVSERDKLSAYPSLLNRLFADPEYLITVSEDLPSNDRCSIRIEVSLELTGCYIMLMAAILTK